MATRTSKLRIDGDANLSAILSDLAALEKLVSSIENRVSVTIDGNSSGVKVAAAQANDALKSVPNVTSAKIDADVALARANIAKLTLQLEELQGKPHSAKVDADIAVAQARLAALGVQLAGLVDKKNTVKIDVDTAKAGPALSALGSSITKIGGDAKTAFGGMTADLGKFVGAINNAGSVAIALGGALQVGGAAVQFLGSALTQLSGLAGLAAGALVGLGVVGATLKVGFAGVGDTIKKAFAAQDAKALTKALQDQSPAVQQLALNIRALKPEWEALRNTVQQKMFAGVGAEISALATKYLPVLKTGMGGVASAINGIIQEFGKFALQKQTVKDVGTAFSTVGVILANLKAGVQPILQIFRDIGIVGLQVIGDMTGNVGGLTTKWAAFIAKARETGQLKKWITDGVQGIKDLGAIVGNVGKVFEALFKGLGGGAGASLGSVRALTDQVVKFMNSAQVQGALKQLGDFLRGTLKTAIDIAKTAWEQFYPAFLKAKPFIEQVSNALSTQLKSAIETLGPILQTVGGFLSDWAPQLAPVIGGVLAFGAGAKILGFVLSPITGLIKGIAGAFSLLQNIGSAAVKMGEFAASSLTAGKNLLTSAGNAASAAGKFAGDAKAWVSLWGEVALNSTKSALETAGAWLKAKGTQAAGAISSLASSVTTFIGHWSRLALESSKQALLTAGAWLKTTGSQVGSALSSMASAATTFIGHWARVAAAATLNAIKTAAAWVITTGAAMVTALATMATAAAGFIASWVLMGVQSLLQAARVAAAWLIAMGPIGWIIAAVIALAALIIANWDTIKAWTIAAWNAVSQAVVDAWNAVVAAVQAGWAAVWGFISGIGSTIAGWATTAWNFIATAATTAWIAVSTAVTNGWNAVWGFISGLGATILGWATAAWNFIVTAASTAWTNVTTAVQTGWSAVWNFLTGLPAQMLQMGKDLIMGLLNGVTGAAGALWDKVKSIGQGVLNTAKSILGIGSPSTVFAGYGQDTALGWQQGLAAGGPAVTAEVSTVATSVGAVGAASTLAAPGVTALGLALTAMNAASALLVPNLLGMNTQLTPMGTNLLGINTQIVPLNASLVVLNAALVIMVAALTAGNAQLVPFVASLTTANAQLAPMAASLVAINAQLAPMVATLTNSNAQLAPMVTSWTNLNVQLAVALPNLTNINGQLVPMVTNLTNANAQVGPMVTSWTNLNAQLILAVANLAAVNSALATYGGATTTANSNTDAMLAKVQAAFPLMQTTIEQAMQAIVQSITDSSNQMYDAWYNALNNMLQTTYDAFAAIGGTIQDWMNAILDYLEALYPSFEAIGANFGISMANGMLSQQQAVFAAGQALGNAATQGANSGIVAASPSKEGLDIGSNFGNAIAMGMDSTHSAIYASAARLGQIATQAATAQLTGTAAMPTGGLPAQGAAAVAGAGQASTSPEDMTVQVFIGNEQLTGTMDKRILVYDKQVRRAHDSQRPR